MQRGDETRFGSVPTDKQKAAFGQEPQIERKRHHVERTARSLRTALLSLSQLEKLRANHQMHRHSPESRRTSTVLK